MPVNRFVVFDVETPNRYNNRMSAIGIDVIEDGRIVRIKREMPDFCAALERAMEEGADG